MGGRLVEIKMLGKIVVAAMMLSVLGSTQSYSQQQALPKVEFISPATKHNVICPPSNCPDYAERLIRHPIVPHLLIPESPMWVDYFRRW